MRNIGTRIYGNNSRRLLNSETNMRSKFMF